MSEQKKSGSWNVLKQLMHNMTDNIYFKDDKSCFLLFNDAFLKWHKIQNAEDVLGKSDFDLFTEEHARQAFEDEKYIMETGNPIIGKVEKETWSDGRVTWVSTTKHPLRDKDGKIIGTFGISRNITENKINEIELEKYAKKMKRINEQMREELRMAANLQSAFLPQSYPIFEADDGKSLIDFYHHYQADTQMGGDYCYVHKINDSEAGVFICDVMGHGVRAALVTAIIRAMIDDLARRSPSPGEFFSKMNHKLFPMLRTQDAFIFATACYLVINVKTGIITGASAGHPAPFLIHNSGDDSVKLMNGFKEISGPALAITENHEYKTFTTQIEPGDTVIMYTDGIYEVCDKNDEEFGEDRVAESLQRNHTKPLKEMFDSLIDDARGFNAKNRFNDDVCLIGFTLNGLQKEETL